MITINGIKFYESPHCCGECPAIILGKNDDRGFCMFFEKRKNRFDGIPKRCQELFKKGFEQGGDLVITLKND